MLTWLTGFGSSRKFALYCSDVAGAFDRVAFERLVHKLQKKGVAERWVQLFSSWLRQRPAHVVVGGKRSAELMLSNMVFQGTVWGPQLWNFFFGDAKKPVRDAGFTEVVFADDLNAFKAFDLATSNEEVLTVAKNCQKNLH